MRRLDFPFLLTINFFLRTVGKFSHFKIHAQRNFTNRPMAMRFVNYVNGFGRLDGNNRVLNSRGSVGKGIKKEHIEVEEESVLHSVPCKIHGDTAANVTNFFTPYIRKNDDKHFDASFRGRPLHGKIITVPEGYKGLVLYESKKPANPEEERNFVSTGGFSKFNYWNFDKLPSKNDAIVSALDWIDIAEALHTPESSS